MTHNFHNLLLSERSKIFQSNEVNEILDLCESERRKGRSIASLNMGIPFYGLLPEIKRELLHRYRDPKISFRKGLDFYAPFAGVYELREALAKLSSQKIGRQVSVPEVVVTTGAIAALSNTLLTILNPGGEVIIPSPYFYSYRQQVELAGGKVREVGLTIGVDGQYELPIEQIESVINKKTKAIIVNSPHNPTGAVFSEQNLRALGEVVKNKNIYLILDEAYDYLVYDNNPCFNLASWAELRPYLVRCGSFSKVYGMTGWRVGYVQAETALIEQIVNFNSCTVMGAGTLAQEAVLIGLQAKDLPSLEKYKAVLAHNRQVIIKELDQLSGLFTYVKPQGAYYIWAKYNLAQDLSSYDFVKRLILEAGASVFPGIGFGVLGEGYVRFSFGGAKKDIQKVFSRIGIWAKKNVG